LKDTITGPGAGDGGKRQTKVLEDQNCVGMAGVSPNTHVKPSAKKWGRLGHQKQNKWEFMRRRKRLILVSSIKLLKFELAA